VKIENYEKVKQLQDERTRLQVRRIVVINAEPNDLGVTIRGKYQDDEIVEACRPVVIAQLESQIAGIENKMRELGVQFPDDQVTTSTGGISE
jgi:hypothetical protein